MAILNVVQEIHTNYKRKSNANRNKQKKVLSSLVLTNEYTNF